MWISLIVPHNNNTLSKIYEESKKKVKVTFQGKKLDKARRQVPEDIERFWAEQAKRNLIWSKEWNKVLDWNYPPFAKWFVGGKLNACFNCLDKHIYGDENDSIIKNKAAIIWEGESGKPGHLAIISYIVLLTKSLML